MCYPDVSSHSSTDQVKGVMTLQGDALCQADVNLKMPRNNQLLHFAFREDKQWKLQQIQDARNHVNQAIYLLMNRDVNYQFKTGLEVLKLMDAVMLHGTHSKCKMFTPALPPDILVNFYINLNKLCLIIYQLHVLQPSTTKNFKPAGGSVLHNPGAMFEFGMECVVPWLNDALVFFTVSLQLCQQLKDKGNGLEKGPVHVLPVSLSVLSLLAESRFSLRRCWGSLPDALHRAGSVYPETQL
uniref:Protein rogdi homolog n=1 Tax=Catharus ustulatus TaxID=91951 RepID=A0A8C3UPG7_CATUS